VIWLLAIGIGTVTAAGVFLSLSRELLRCVVGVSLLAAAANLIVFSSGHPEAGPKPPVVPVGLEQLVDAAAPLPQALVLTAIVIGFSLTCFSLVVVLAIAQQSKSNDNRALRDAEPRPGPDGKPALESLATEDQI